MLVHSVYFWLRDNLSDDERAAFRQGVESLRAIETVKEMHVGTPAATPDRPVVDRSYDLALTVVLDDIPGHDIYQDHEIHHAFVENFSTYWTRVQIYDAD